MNTTYKLYLQRVYFLKTHKVIDIEMICFNVYSLTLKSELKEQIWHTNVIN